MGRCSPAYQYPLSGVGAACSELGGSEQLAAIPALYWPLRRRGPAYRPSVTERARSALLHWPGATPPCCAPATLLCVLRYGRRQGSGGAEAGFCARTAAGTPPCSLPARCPPQLRTAARGQGGVGECMARQTPRPTSSRGSLPADWGRPAGLPRSAPAGNQPSSPLGDFLPGPSPSSVPLLLQVLSGCGVYDGTEIHEASA